AQEEIVKNIGLGEYAPKLYEGDLPDEKITQMLDWDAPLSEQPESVRAAINSSLSDDDVYQSWLENGAIDKIKGGLLYNRIVDNAGDAVGGTRGAAGSQQAAASQKLKELGIPGIKYFDGSSRSAGEGTRNFVVFDENDMSILSRNGEKTLP
ncbi:MAG: hypothetical protein GY774_36155, partial [Planctomycetes bacterium]|nr:hypothetical protein [Planctomycetota bacterium]